MVLAVPLVRMRLFPEALDDIPSPCLLKGNKYNPSVGNVLLPRGPGTMTQLGMLFHTDSPSLKPDTLDSPVLRCNIFTNGVQIAPPTSGKPKSTYGCNKCDR